MDIEFRDQKLELLSDKAVFIYGSETIVISDLHFGKASHFRKSGISIPMQSVERDYMRLNALIEKKQPSRVIIIGDLFHSAHNNEWRLFCEFVADNSKMKFILVRGNHDVLSKEHYSQVCMEIAADTFSEAPFIFSHEPLNEFQEGMFNISGHIHPGYLLQGKGKQRIALPCFYRNRDQLILPAFGGLTGLQLLEKVKGSEVYVIANEKVIAI